jgi:iron transport multicopper oxidase
LIIHDPKPPYGKVDGELVMTVGDWYYSEAPYLINFYQSVNNTSGAEPIPESALLNEGQDVRVQVEPDKTYLVRIINNGNFVGAYFEIDGHEMEVVALDGVYVQPQKVPQLYLTAAQRVDFLIKTKASTSKNYLLRAALDTDMFDETPEDYDPSVFGFLMYNNDKDPKVEKTPLEENEEWDDLKFQTHPDYKFEDNDLDHVDYQVYMEVDFADYEGITRATVNDVTYLPQKVPSLYTALTTGEDAKNEKVYGINSNPFVIPYDKVVEIILVNKDPGHHPFHLHGQTFQVWARAPENSTFVKGQEIPKPTERPVRRDTVQVLASSWASLRFRSSNPGTWLIHCHIEWHIVAGLVSTLIVGPDKLQAQPLKIPEDHLEVCRRLKIPTQGNAAGRKGTDLTGANTEIPRSPMGAMIPPGILGPPDPKYGFWQKSRMHNCEPAKEPKWQPKPKKMASKGRYHR